MGRRIKYFITIVIIIIVAGYTEQAIREYRHLEFRALSVAESGVQESSDMADVNFKEQAVCEPTAAPAARPKPSPTATPPPVPTAPPTPEPPIYTLQPVEQTMIDIVNQHRRNAGVEELVADTSFYECAYTRAVECDTVFSHTRPNGEKFSSVFAEKGIIIYAVVGENLAKYFQNAERAMELLMTSESHRENILRGGIHQDMRNSL